MRARSTPVILAVLLAAGFAPAPAIAHGIAGDRFFPATLTVDDPAVADELSLPTVSHLDGQTDVSGEYSKRLTPTLGVSFGGTWSRIGAPGEPAATGFQNLETTAKWQFLTSAPHEAIVALGLSAEWGGTGADAVGAERHTTLTPTLYFGKGAGDLPQSMGWARPFALTGQLGYDIPTRRRDPGETDDNPRVLSWGLTLQYSLAYLQAHVRDVGLAAPFDRMVPLVEASFETPLTGPDRRTTGTINPGVIWAGRHVQLGAEALVPVNAASGRHVGGVVQLHLFLDDLFPRSIGRPIWQEDTP
jgi:hypothetical protein